MPKPRILCISFDKMVSDNRRITLKEAGYEVMVTTNVKEALELLTRERFDAVIVGHRFPADEKYVLAVEAKEKSDTPVVLVCGVGPECEIPATTRVYALEGSAGLLSALSAVLSTKARSQAA
jgi:DNA-binding response OmpR family regulator